MILFQIIGWATSLSTIMVIGSLGGISNSCDCQTVDSAMNYVFKLERLGISEEELRDQYSYIISESSDSIRYSIMFTLKQNHEADRVYEGGPSIILRKRDCKVLRVFRGEADMVQYFKVFDPSVDLKNYNVSP